jgi:hypothetical protein
LISPRVDIFPAAKIEAGVTSILAATDPLLSPSKQQSNGNKLCVGDEKVDMLVRARAQKLACISISLVWLKEKIYWQRN